MSGTEYLILSYVPLIAKNAYFRSQHNSFSFDKIFLTLTYDIGLKLVGQLDRDVVQRIFFEVKKVHQILIELSSFFFKSFQNCLCFRIAPSTAFLETWWTVRLCGGTMHIFSRLK